MFGYDWFMRYGSLNIIAICVLGASASLLAKPIELSAKEIAAIESLPKVGAGLNRSYAIQRKRAKQVDCTLFYMVVAPDLNADDWVFMAPWAPDLPSQKIRYVRSSPTALVAYEQSALRRKLLVFKMEAGKNTRNTAGVKVFYGAQLYSSQLLKLKENEQQTMQPKSLSKRDRQLFLRPGKYNHHTDPRFIDWVANKGYVRKSREGEIDFARRVFQGLAQNFKYVYTSQMDRKLMSICTAQQSDCGGLSSLFVSVMRSQGIPARSLVGRWATSSVKGEKVGDVPYFQTHVKAEFHAQGVGWVPVDLSSAVLYDRSKEKLAYFGRDPGDFITMHLDADLRVDTYHFGIKELGWLQDVVFWVRGSGTLDGRTGTGTWQVK